MHFSRFAFISKSIIPIVLLLAPLASGQEVAEPAPEVTTGTEEAPAEPEPEPTEPEAPAAVEEAPVETAPPTETPTKEAEMEETRIEEEEAAPEEEAKEEEEGILGGINWGVWGRVDFAASGQDSLDDFTSSGRFELHSSGSLHKYVNFTANFVANYNPEIAGNAALLDGIVQFDFADAFHVWGGRMLVPVDRSNFSGPWFMTPWYYPGFGFADGQVAAPREGPSGRNDGATVWGSFAGGLIKYYVGAFDLFNADQTPLYSGRLNFSFLNKESGFYSNSSYLGEDTFSIGVGGQYKADGSVGVAADPADPAPTDDYAGFNADILFEKKIGDAGVLNLEGAVYLFTGEYEATEASWFGVASYLIPAEVGIGKFQPVFRVQQAFASAEGADTSTLIDSQLSYLIDGFAARLSLGYRYGFAGDLKTQSLYLGAQFIK
jgi:hypothetical protein